MSAASVGPEQRFRLSGIDWATYVTYSDSLGPRHVRVTYDRGEMELMTLSSRHERGKHRLSRLVEALVDELQIEYVCLGSMTCRREDLERGLEPDECYWFAHEPQVRDRDDVRFPEDPPPDLALEVEISRSTIDRLGLYASLGVPEVWRWDGETLRVMLLSKKGRYGTGRHSRAFPFLPLKEFADFLTKGSPGNVQLVREFRAWVREQQDKGWESPGGKPGARPRKRKS